MGSYCLMRRVSVWNDFKILEMEVRGGREEVDPVMGGQRRAGRR